MGHAVPFWKAATTSFRDTLVGIEYQTDNASSVDAMPLRYEVSVAARRMLCEIRDQYLHRLPTFGARAVSSETGMPANS